MEMDLRDRNAMHGAFRLSDQAVNRKDILFHRVRQRKMFSDQMLDLVQAAVMVIRVMGMTVGMHVFRLLFPIDRYRQMGTADPAPAYGLPGIRHMGNTDAVKLRKRLFLIRHQFQQRRRQHIACCSHITFQIQ